jgi:hypothetical protein
MRMKEPTTLLLSQQEIDEGFCPNVQRHEGKKQPHMRGTRTSTCNLCVAYQRRMGRKTT